MFRLDSQASEETKLLRERLTTLADENKQLKSKMDKCVKEKQAAERKINQQALKYVHTRTSFLRWIFFYFNRVQFAD